MKKLLIILSLLIPVANADEYPPKSMENKYKSYDNPVFSNNSMIESSGSFTSFTRHGVIMLTGRATYVDNNGDSVQMTVPYKYWNYVINNINKPLSISYAEANWMNINSDLPIELIAVL